MKKKSYHRTIKALLICMISVMFIAACGNGNNGKANNGNANSGNANSSNTEVAKGSGEDTQEVTSKDGQVQLSVNKTWKEDPALNNLAILQVSERKNEKYAMVNAVSKADMAEDTSLNDFKTAFITNIKLSVTNAEVSNEEQITVDSTEAELFEITGEAEKVKVQYLVAVLEKGGSFYQVVTWSLASKFESNKQELLEVIKSFKVLKETPATSTSANPADTGAAKEEDTNKTTTMTSDDKKMEITVPAYMTAELELSPQADIYASRAQQEEYMMVMREGKEVFEDNFTLDDYYKVISQSMSQNVTNATLTEAKKIQVNGQPAMQFEINGEMEKIKISYLVTLVETETSFTQVLFWTLQSYMDEKRDMFIQASSTFKEVQ